MSAGRRYCSNCGIALDVGGGCFVCKPEKESSYVKLRNELLCSPATAFALADVVKRFDERDPVDALKDAETLVTLFRARADEALRAGRMKLRGSFARALSVLV